MRSRRGVQRLVALAGPDVVDGLRGRRQLIVRSVTPIVLFVAVLGVSLLMGGDDPARSGADTWRVAVEGDWEGAAATLAVLDTRRVELRPTRDASVAVIDGAHVGLRLPDRLDERVAAGEQVVLDVVEVTLDGDSRAAVAHLRAALASRTATRQLRAVGRGADESRFVLDVTQVELTRRGRSVLGAELVAAVLCIQAAMLVGGAANRFAGRSTGGLLVTQLVLPVPRRSLALGKGLAELLVGLVAGLPVLLGVVVLTVVVTVSSPDTAAPAEALAAVVLSAAVLGAFMAAVGLLIGVAARGPEQVTLGTGAAVVLAAVVATVVGLGDLPRPVALAGLPVVGVVSELRAYLSGSERTVAMLVALAVTVVAALGVSVLAGRSLDTERLVGRAR